MTRTNIALSVCAVGFVLSSAAFGLQLRDELTPTPAVTYELQLRTPTDVFVTDYNMTVSDCIAAQRRWAPQATGDDYLVCAVSKN